MSGSGGRPGCEPGRGSADLHSSKHKPDNLIVNCSRAWVPAPKRDKRASSPTLSPAQQSRPALPAAAATSVLPFFVYEGDADDCDGDYDE